MMDVACRFPIDIISLFPFSIRPRPSIVDLEGATRMMLE